VTPASICKLRNHKGIAARPKIDLGSCRELANPAAAPWKPPTYDHFQPKGHTLDLKEFKTIVDVMKRADLTEFEIEEEGFKLRIKRSTGRESPTIVTTGNPPFPMMGGAANPSYQASGPEGGESTPPPDQQPAQGAKQENAGVYVRSPMVGTFYRSPSPDSAPYVDTGDSVQADTVVCIIEAMKVMNEIQAEAKGRVVECLVENGSSVEYDQPLFKLKP